MRIQIEGNGSFGSFLKNELPKVGFKVVDDASTVILAVPFSAYAEMGLKYRDRHLINVCSVQTPSTDILLKYTLEVTSIHPLFGPRTPEDKRFTLWTYDCESELENEFMGLYSNFSPVVGSMNRDEHDEIMSRTHVAAVLAAKQLKHFVEQAEDIPDEYLPNSFRLLKQFVKTLDDMPHGTIESIMANPYI